MFITIAGLGCNKFRTQSTDIVSSMWAVEMFVFNDVHRGGVLFIAFYCHTKLTKIGCVEELLQLVTNICRTCHHT